MRLVRELLENQTSKTMLVEVLDKLKRMNIDAVLREMAAEKSRVKVNIIEEEININSNAIKYAFRCGYEDCIQDLFSLEDQVNNYRAGNKAIKPSFGSAKILEKKRINVGQE